MADAYLQWKYGYGVVSKPQNHQPAPPPPTTDVDTPPPDESSSSDPTDTSIDNALPNTPPSINTSTDDAAADHIPARGAPTINTPAGPPDGVSNVLPRLPSSTEGGPGGGGITLDGVDIEIAVVDIYTLSTSVKVSSADEGTTASALADLGFIGNAPFNPSIAVSMKTLELYRILRRRKPSFSIEAFVKVISDLYLVRLPPVASTHCI